MFKKCLLCVTLLISGHVMAEGEKSPLPAHVHGIGEVEMAQDANALLVTLHAPMINLVGFEHKPETAEEKKNFDLVVNLLRIKAVVTPSPKAKCILKRVDVQPDFGGEHSDVDTTWEFDCASPEALTQVGFPLLFNAFPRFTSISAAAVTAAGQFGAKLYPHTPELKLQ